MSGGTSLFRIASQWLVGAALAAILVAFFALLSAAQTTSRESAERIQRRAIAVTTDIDALLPAIESQIEAFVQEYHEGPVPVDSFPIPIELTREEAQLRGDALRARILELSATRVYDDGMSAWAKGDETANQNVERVSTAGALHRSLGLLTETWHVVFVVLAAAAGILALTIAAVLLFSLQSQMRLIALGAVTVAAALPSLAAAVAVRFAMRTAETDADPFEEGMLELGVDTSWIFIRNYLILSMLGLAVLGAAAFTAWLNGRQAPAGGEVSYGDAGPLSP